MEKLKDKLINILESYLPILIVSVMCVVFLTIDLIKFGVNTDPKITLMLTVIYIFMSVTISYLLRTQGILLGKRNENYIKAEQDYNLTLNSISEVDKLDSWCEQKNYTIHINAIKRELRFNHLSYEDWEAGKYEIPNSKKEKKEFFEKYSKRQLKALDYCRKIETIEHYSSAYLTSDLDKEQLKHGAKEVNVSKYLTSQTKLNVLTAIIISIVFAFLTVSLAEEISLANLFFSLIKVVLWLGGGALSFLMAYMFIIQTYRNSLIDKTNKLKEFSVWLSKQQTPTTSQESVIEADVKNQNMVKEENQD